MIIILYPIFILEKVSFPSSSNRSKCSLSRLYSCSNAQISKKKVRKMSWSFTSDSPIYLQIAEIIKFRILRGEYPPRNPDSVRPRAGTGSGSKSQYHAKGTDACEVGRAVNHPAYYRSDSHGASGAYPVDSSHPGKRLYQAALSLRFFYRGDQ